MIEALPLGTAQQALLAGAIDYAGLFPPAQLGMPAAVANYVSYRASAEAWALGRFVVPAARLDEFATVVGSTVSAGPTIPLSVLIGPRSVEELLRIEAFEHGPAGTLAPIESVEVSAAPDQVGDLLGAVPARWRRYVEIPIEREVAAALDAIGEAGAFAKARTGGVTPEAFPPPEALTRFLAAAAYRRIPFKATAGLHHPLRGSYRLTYQSDSAHGIMYGYLNLALASAILWRHGEAAAPLAAHALAESAASSLRWEEGGVSWGGERFDTPFLTLVRRDFFHGFGSCSFREPLDELAVLGVLPQ